MRNEKIGFKIREHTLQRIPYLVVVGDKEAASQQVSLRSQEGVNLGIMTLSELYNLLEQEIVYKGLNKNELEE